MKDHFSRIEKGLGTLEELLKQILEELRRR